MHFAVNKGPFVPGFAHEQTEANSPLNPQRLFKTPTGSMDSLARPPATAQTSTGLPPTEGTPPPTPSSEKPHSPAETIVVATMEAPTLCCANSDMSASPTETPSKENVDQAQAKASGPGVPTTEPPSTAAQVTSTEPARAAVAQVAATETPNTGVPNTHVAAASTQAPPSTEPRTVDPASKLTVAVAPSLTPEPPKPSLREKLALKAREREEAKHQQKASATEEEEAARREMQLQNDWAEALDRKRAAEAARIEMEELKTQKYVPDDDLSDDANNMYNDGSYWRTAGALCAWSRMLSARIMSACAACACTLTCSTIMCIHAITYGFKHGQAR